MYINKSQFIILFYSLFIFLFIYFYFIYLRSQFNLIKIKKCNKGADSMSFEKVLFNKSYIFVVSKTRKKERKKFFFYINLCYLSHKFWRLLFLKNSLNKNHIIINKITISIVSFLLSEYENLKILIPKIIVIIR